ncbi:MAG: segregation/condensation protein A [Deltaproteobacteria bacterium]|nr:segregation/condensation protein A [Deltaproteobacteria bacterium]
MDYEVKLEIFEGPLDLLLHLIRKNELDIFDIPIATITDQYLEYLDMMKALNITLAGDFLVMASTLTHIKSKMLLPGLEDDEEEDPRVELTRPLLEYLRLKEIAGELSERELLDRDVFTSRLSAYYRTQLQGEEPLLDVNLFQLVDAFKKIVEKVIPGASLRIRTEKWSLKEKTALIMELLKSHGAIYFSELFREDRTVSEFIITFLALLELIHIGMVRVFQTAPDKDIRLEALFENKEDNDHG